jgi:hypothetical protein
VEKLVLVVTCVAADTLPCMSKCDISCLSELSRNAFLKEFVVLAAATHMHSVAT